MGPKLVMRKDWRSEVDVRFFSVRFFSWTFHFCPFRVLIVGSFSFLSFPFGSKLEAVDETAFPFSLSP